MAYDPADPIWQSDVLCFACQVAGVDQVEFLAHLEMHPEKAEVVRTGLLRLEAHLQTRDSSPPEG